MRVIELLSRHVEKLENDKFEIIAYWFSQGEKDAEANMPPQLQYDCYLAGYEDMLYRQEVFTVRRLQYFYVITPLRKLSLI